MCSVQFQIDEVLHINNGDISFHCDLVTINFDRSKTDLLGKRSQVVISENSSIATRPIKFSFYRTGYLSEVEKSLVEAGQ